ncbi:MAG: TolC family protein [Planctomycetales bacterium]
MNTRGLVWGIAALSFALSANFAYAQRAIPTLLREQRSTSIRDPEQLPKYRLRDPEVTPETVSRPQQDLAPIEFSLDEALHRSMENTNVVRVLTGVTAVASGRTIYDASVTNTTIDMANSQFDPTLNATNTWNRLENPTAIFDPIDPNFARITGIRTDYYNTSTQLQKQNAFGGVLGFGVTATPTNFRPGVFPLNTQTTSATNLSYTQPLLKGSRVSANFTPIIVARINTEFSFFQFKDAMQEQVRGVIEAYWALVAARVDVWARRRQIDQLTEAVKQIKGGVAAQRVNRADQAQTELSLATTRATLIASEANMIQREAALRNILGMAVSDGTRLVPVTPPFREQIDFDWENLMELAADRRPDVIELKLILEADQQLIVQARNNALPQLNAVGQYQWNGLDGVMPNGNPLSAPSGAYANWTTGVTFSVPIWLRQARAQLRQQELVVMRDRINLNQGLHAAEHNLATTVRSISQTYEQYLAYREARRAARVNLEYQLSRYKTQQGILLNVLQAISDWGNSITAEAQALTQYNTQLANLERQSGTILETHGIVFVEERFGSIGPMGRFFKDRPYSSDLLPTENSPKYPVSDKPSEEDFDLKSPPNLREINRDVPYEDIKLPTLEEILNPPAKPGPG